jgi:formate hydrogenlyase transcriptional activator
VLIRGETGTGKELIARALHELSPRKDRTFIKLNCAAIPSGLLESELFGHEKGAFTGAVGQKIGRFEVAHKGTLFLDEVGDIPLELQPKLLRVLQEQEFERLGGTKTITVDVRLVAATHRDLAKMVAEGRFREDLYYRLNVFPVTMPPLRERADDIPRLVAHFTQRFARRMGRQIESIPTEVMDALVGYSWPGNVRELQNIIERAVILSSGASLQVPLGDLQPVDKPALVPTAAAVTLADAEREHILSVLHQTDWVLGGPPWDEALHAAMEDEEAGHLTVRVVPTGWRSARPLAFGSWHVSPLPPTVATCPVRKSFAGHSLRDKSTIFSAPERPLL